MPCVDPGISCGLARPILYPTFVACACIFTADNHSSPSLPPLPQYPDAQYRDA